MLFLLRDDFSGEQRLAELRAELGSADVQSLNLSMLDGSRLTLAELRGAVEALPFLGDYRLVVVRRLFGAGGGRGEADGESGESRRGRADAEREREFLAYLPRVPETTKLVLIEDKEFKTTHPVAAVVRKASGEVRLESPPEGEQLAEWIEQRVRVKDGRIDRPARDVLAEVAAGDLRALDHILDTLVTHADDRAISVADVRALVSRSREVTVFALVDAVGARDGRGALDAYRRLLNDDESPIYLLVMLTRQMRLLLLTHEALENRQEVGAALKVPPWVARKLTQQTRAFGVDRCLAAYRQLADVDQAIKTGQAREDVVVELLIVGLTDR